MTRQAAEDIAKIKSCGYTDTDEIISSTGLTKKRVKLLLSIMNGKRIDYSLMNSTLHSKDNYEHSGDNNLGGCLADMLELLEEHIDSERDREIFLTWIQYLNKNNKTRLVAQKVNGTMNEVADSVKKTKSTLKNIVKGVAQNA